MAWKRSFCIAAVSDPAVGVTILIAAAVDVIFKLGQFARTSSHIPFLLPHRRQEAACWVHARRPFFIMADIEENARRKAAGKKEIPLSPVAIEVVRRIDALFEIERAINGKSAAERLAVRQKLSGPLVENLQVYLREQLAKFSRGHDLAKAINTLGTYHGVRKPHLRRYLDEFVYRWNRRRHMRSSFDMLLSIAARLPHVGYRQFVEQMI